LNIENYKSVIFYKKDKVNLLHTAILYVIIALVVGVISAIIADYFIYLYNGDFSLTFSDHFNKSADTADGMFLHDMKFFGNYIFLIFFLVILIPLVENFILIMLFRFFNFFIKQIYFLIILLSAAWGYIHVISTGSWISFFPIFFGFLLMHDLYLLARKQGVDHAYFFPLLEHSLFNLVICLILISMVKN